MRLALAAAVVALAALAAASTAGATNECRGLNPCVPVAGPWVVVPPAKTVPRDQVQYQLDCPKGYVAAGIDAEVTDRAIDLTFLGTSGAPVSPGVTTSRSVVFVAAYVGAAAKAPTFRPHIGCVPATGGGGRTPTGVRAVTPPGHPTTRRVVQTRVRDTSHIVVRCHAGERLVDWHTARAFATPAPPGPALVASLTTSTRAAGRAVVVTAHAAQHQGLVQVSAVCAGDGT